MISRSMVLWLCASRRVLRFRPSFVVRFLLLSAACFGVMGCGQTDGGNDEIPVVVTEFSTITAEVELLEKEFSTLPAPTIQVIVSSPTPLPSATPTPSPTPIVYAIQSGDTLLGIAIQNQTTVEQIQALNPDARPELLSIGQQLILPPPATPVFRGEAPTQIPISAEIISYALFSDGGGGVWVLGEVKNGSAWGIERLNLEVSLFGEAGQVAAQVIAPVSLPFIQAGQTSPFGVLFPQKPAGDVQAGVKIADGFANTDPDANGVQELLVEDIGFEQAGNLVTINGRLANVGTFQTSSIDLHASLYDSSGRLIGFSKTTIEANSLSPTEPVAIELQAFALQGAVSEAKITAIPVNDR